MRPERMAHVETYARETPWTRALGGEKEAVDHALAHCVTRESVVSERMLVTEALKRGLGAVGVNEVHLEMTKRPLIRGELNGRHMAIRLTRGLLAGRFCVP